MTLRRSKRAESVRVAMNQDGLPVAEALVWLVTDDLDGLTHDVAARSAALAAHGPDSGYFAPNLDLTVQFHQTGTTEEWLFAEGHAEVAQDGLIGFRSRVWSRDRRLLSSGSGQLLCRPI